MAERIEIIVTTDADDAAGTLDALADQVEELTGIRPEVTVAADTDDAADGLDAVAETADELDGTAAAVDVSAPGAADAVADIDAVQAAAFAAAESAGEIGPAAEGSAGSVKGATKDMLRPLGLAKSTVGDLTDAFQLMADEAISSMDLTEKQVGQLAGALPVVGVVIGLAVTAWQTYSRAQEEAAAAADRSADSFEDVGEALSTGDIRAAAAELRSANADIIADAEAMGVPFEELADFILGAADSMPTLDAAFAKGEDGAGALNVAAHGARDAFLGSADGARVLGTEASAWESAVRTYAEGLGGAAAEAAELAGYLEAVNAALDTQASRLDVAESVDTLESSLAAAAAAAFEFGAGSEEASDANRTLQGDLIEAKQDVLDYAEEVGGIPPEKLTEILALIDQGKLSEAERALDFVARDRTAEIRAVVKAGPYSGYLGGGFGGSGRAAAPQAAAGPTLMAAPAAALAIAPAPSVTISVDARGTIDPYSVGLAVERAAGAWGRVSGQWRPGQRAGAG